MKAILTEEARALDKIYEDLANRCRRTNVKQKHIASELGISQAGVSHLLNHKKLSLEQYVSIMCLVNRRETDVRDRA